MIGWMTVRRFEWAICTRGADLATWPAREAAFARALLRRSARAREIFADALTQEAEPAFEPDCLARILGSWRRRLVAEMPVQTGIRWGALAVCAMAGLYFGMSFGTAAGPDLTQVVLAAAVP